MSLKRDWTDKEGRKKNPLKGNKNLETTSGSDSHWAATLEIGKVYILPIFSYAFVVTHKECFSLMH